MAETTARIVLSAEDKTGAALASLRAGLAGVTNQATALQGVFTRLVPALTFAGAATFVKSINDGVDAFNDLKDATGASIENISALEDIAARTGTSFDTVGTSLIKFNQALAQADEGSNVAKALKAIGLEASELKKLDPAEALRRTAVALSGYADDAGKARLVQEIFGRSLREVAPFLNDLATQTQLVAKVTAEQAAEAEKFNKELFTLQKNATDAGRALTADLVKGLNEAAKAFREGGLVQGLQTLFTGNDEFKASKTLVQDTEKLLNLENAIAQARASGAKDDGRILSNLLAQKKQTEENIKLTQNYLQVLRGDVSLTGAKPKAETAPALEFNPDAEKRLEEQRKKLLAENEKARQTDLAGWVRYAEERVQADFDATKQIADQQIQLNKELNDARQLQMQQWFQTIDQEQEDALAAGREIINQAEQDARRLENVGRDLGFTFSSAFENAIVDGEKLSKVIQGLGQDIVRIVVRNTITKPFAESITGSLGKVFGFADGGIMTPSGPLPLRAYASGGIASTPQLALFGEGSMNEAFVPLPDGKRIPVDLGDARTGAAQITYAPVIHVDSRTDRREVYELVDKALRANNAQLVDRLQRQGRL